MAGVFVLHHVVYTRNNINLCARYNARACYYHQASKLASHDNDILLESINLQAESSSHVSTSATVVSERMIAVALSFGRYACRLADYGWPDR